MDTLDDKEVPLLQVFCVMNFGKTKFLFKVLVWESNVIQIMMLNQFSIDHQYYP